MCFVSKQEEKAIIKVPGAYMFTVCPKVEQELKACLQKGCQKVHGSSDFSGHSSAGSFQPVGGRGKLWRM